MSVQKEMKLERFCRGIGLAKGVAGVLCGMERNDREYEAMRSLYEKDRAAFYRKVGCQQDAEKLFLYYYSRFACDTYEKYKERRVKEQIYFDTFRDIALWCDDCIREIGKWGLGNCVWDWFWRSFEMKVFRLGRLEFEEMEAEEEMIGEHVHIRKGEPVISIHIPAGGPLIEEECRMSIQEAYRLFGEGKQYFCHSWLLFPGLKDFLAKESNILRFQELFEVIKTDYREREAEWRLFGRNCFRIADYAEDTSLQRRIKQYLLSGGSLGNGWGILKK